MAENTDSPVKKKPVPPANAPIVAPMTVIPGEQPDFDVEKMLADAKQTREDEETRMKNLRDSEYLYFVKCRYHPHDESSHGVYLTRCPGPGEPVKMTEWWARYKLTPNELYVGSLICQACFERGIENPLDVQAVGKRGEFVVSERWLWRRPKDKKRLMVEGETRVRDVTAVAANNGRQAAIARSVAAGLEEIQ